MARRAIALVLVILMSGCVTTETARRERARQLDRAALATHLTGWSVAAATIATAVGLTLGHVNSDAWGGPLAGASILTILGMMVSTLALKLASNAYHH